MINPVIIFGTGPMGHHAMEIFESNGVTIYGFLEEDASRHGTELNSISILGKPDDDGFLKLIGKKCDAFVASDDNAYRKSMVKMLNERRQAQPVNAVHKRAVLGVSVSLGHGNMINSGAIVEGGATIGQHCVIHSNAVVGSMSKLGDYVQVGIGSIINSNVEISDEAFIGSGVTIVANVKIGKKARIGAGSVVIASVKDGETVFGNPAQVVK